jgi:hypothetical protein
MIPDLSSTSAIRCSRCTRASSIRTKEDCWNAVTYFARSGVCFSFSTKMPSISALWSGYQVLTYAAKRLVQAVVVVLLAYVFTFVVVSILPCDPITNVLRDPQNGFTEDEIKVVNAAQGLWRCSAGPTSRCPLTTSPRPNATSSVQAAWKSWSHSTNALFSYRRHAAAHSAVCLSTAAAVRQFNVTPKTVAIWSKGSARAVSMVCATASPRLFRCRANGACHIRGRAAALQDVLNEIGDTCPGCS